MFDALRTLGVSAAIVVVAWQLIPRGWYARLSLGERWVVWIFLVVRVFLMPWVYLWMNSSSGQIFSTDGSDALYYHASGSEIAGDLVGSLTVLTPGTNFMNLFVGAFYWSAGVNYIAASLLWSCLGVIGSLLFWQATRPFIQTRRTQFAAVLLLLPSMMFWNAGLSKEALVLLGVGSMAMGFSRFHRVGRIPVACLYLVFGSIVSGLIRPHITLLVLLAFLLGTLFVAPGASKASFPERMKASSVITLVGLACLPVYNLLIESRPHESPFDTFYRYSSYAADQPGGSSFQANVVDSPLDVPNAIVTVLFRPFLWEATTIAQLAVGIESTFIVGLGLWNVLLIIYRRAYVSVTPFFVSSLTYLIMFSVALSSYGNFGLLARQRTMAMGFLVVAAYCVTIRREDYSGAKTGPQPVESDL